MATLNGVLLLIAWSVICVLILVLYRVARFYELTSGRASRYHWFLIPLLLFAAAAVVHLINGTGPDLITDMLLLLGSASLIGLGYNLLHLMTGNRS
jgi:hypothetical protein